MPVFCQQLAKFKPIDIDSTLTCHNYFNSIDTDGMLLCVQVIHHCFLQRFQFQINNWSWIGLKLKSLVILCRKSFEKKDGTELI